MKSDYCPDVWKSIYLRKKDSDRVEVGFCCQNVTVVCNNSEIAAVLDTKREKFISHKHDPQCNNCWEVENYGSQSRRYSAIEWFKNNDIALDNVAQFVSLDWNSDNLCNLACISCGPKYSSKWSSEISKYPWSDTNSYNVKSRDNVIYEHLDFSKIKRVYFNGGEPLMSKDHVKILSLIKDHGRLNHCEISYNTNGTHIPTQEIIDLWRDSGLVRILLSVDAVGDAFEYIRWPGRWAQIQEFIDKVFSLDFVVILDITTTVGIHNIFELPALISWYEKTCAINPFGDPGCLNLQSIGNISHGGNVLNLAHLEKELAVAAIEKISPFRIRYPQIDYFIEILKNTNSSTRLWLEYFKQLDEKRGTDWRSSLNELNYLVSN